MIKTIHMTLLMGPMLPMPVPKNVMDSLVSAQVTVASGQKSGFQLQFKLGKGSAVNQAMLAAGYFDPPTRVILIATVGALPEVLIDGVIVRQEVNVTNNLGESTLTLTGEDLTLLMDLKQNKSMPFPGMTEIVRVNLLVAKYAMYGIIPVVIPNLFPSIPIPIKQIDFQEGTDLEYIDKLANENGYVFYLSPGPAPGVSTAYWGPEIRIGVPQPALNVNMDAHSNVDSLSFGFDASQPTDLGVTIQEPNSKIGIDIPLPSISLLSPPLAVRQAPALKFKTLENVAKFDATIAIAKGLAKKSQSSDAVSGSGQLDVLRYGRILKARQLVGVRGAGIAYDGLYFVKSVTHNIRRGEYKQSFTLARNGLVSITPAVPV